MSSRVGVNARGVISSPMSPSSKCTALPFIAPSLAPRSGFASDLRLLHDRHLFTLLVFVGRLADDEDHLTRPAGFLIDIGDARFHRDGIARAHGRIEFAALAGVKGHLAEFHLGVRQLVSTEDVIKDWRGGEAAGGALFCWLRVH